MCSCFGLASNLPTVEFTRSTVDFFTELENVLYALRTSALIFLRRVDAALFLRRRGFVVFRLADARRVVLRFAVVRRFRFAFFLFFGAYFLRQAGEPNFRAMVSPLILKSRLSNGQSHHRSAKPR
jgi:hypothetical protein